MNAHRVYEVECSLNVDAIQRGSFKLLVIAEDQDALDDLDIWDIAAETISDSEDIITYGEIGPLDTDHNVRIDDVNTSPASPIQADIAWSEERGFHSPDEAALDDEVLRAGQQITEASHTTGARFAATFNPDVHYLCTECSEVNDLVFHTFGGGE